MVLGRVFVDTVVVSCLLTREWAVGTEVTVVVACRLTREWTVGCVVTTPGAATNKKNPKKIRKNIEKAMKKA